MVCGVAVVVIARCNFMPGFKSWMPNCWPSTVTLALSENVREMRDGTVLHFHHQIVTCNSNNFISFYFHFLYRISRGRARRSLNLRVETQSEGGTRR
jgi:hypothetical protein